MTSIFERQLGSDFGRLQPELRERFGFCSADDVACIGTGVMERIWRGPAFPVPFLMLGTARHILFPEQGRDVPFTIENYAYRDSYDRETVTFVRTFHLPRRPRLRLMPRGSLPPRSRQGLCPPRRDSPSA